MDSADKKPAPPYVAYKTLNNFLERFKQGLPARIDRGLMGSMSGAAQSQVTTALRYLGMITENNIPTQLMRRYVTGEESERKAALAEMLMGAYPFILDTDGAFSLSTATASQLREAFAENTSASGETLVRCMGFFKDAARDAGFNVSPFIVQKKSRAPAAKKKPGIPRKEEKPAERTSRESPHISPHIGFPAQSSPLLFGLFQRLPKPGTVWNHGDRERWVQTLNNVLMLEYPES